jgi:hypothetical protein
MRCAGPTRFRKFPLVINPFHGWQLPAFSLFIAVRRRSWLQFVTIPCEIAAGVMLK